MRGNGLSLAELTMNRAGVHISGVPDFWKQVKDAHHRFLGLDYDGTLAPFQVGRMDARPLPETLDLLIRLCNCPNTTLAIISGRPSTEIVQLIGNLPIQIVGAHGYEFRSSSGELRVIVPEQEDMERLEAAYTAAKELQLGNQLEEKTASIAVHVRGQAKSGEIIGKVREIWKPFILSGGLSLREFDGGIELRANNRNKATAVGEIFAGLPRDTLTIYLGDDGTDEDVFDYLSTGNGIGIKVGDFGSATTAMGRLRDCDHVLEFLRSWNNLICSEDRMKTDG